MDLTVEQQERYARHLLLDGWGGEGQERLLAATVRVRGAATGSLWAARYLAASGVGTVVVEPSLVAACAAMNPDSRVLASGAAGRGPDLELEPGPTAFDGARAALEACARIAGAAP